MVKNNMIKNRYHARCSLCGKLVGPNEGVCVPTIDNKLQKWDVYHESCYSTLEQINIYMSYLNLAIKNKNTEEIRSYIPIIENLLIPISESWCNYKEVSETIKRCKTQNISL